MSQCGVSKRIRSHGNGATTDTGGRTNTHMHARTHIHSFAQHTHTPVKHTHTHTQVPSMPVRRRGVPGGRA